MRALHFSTPRSLLRLLTWLIAGGSFVLASSVLTPSAHADPHAMFYTVIGQQQLFFNVLAALDQADYVEPDATRANLLKLRDEASPDSGSDFKEDEDPILKQTQTNLSSVLTRGITLEGQDLWSTYLAYQAAKERSAQLKTDEDVRFYCETVLGRPGCEEDEPPKAAAPYKYDGNDFEMQRVTDGYLGALASDADPKSEDQIIRTEKAKSAGDPDKLVQGRAWSYPIALLRQGARDSKNNEVINAMGSLLNAAIPGALTSSVDYNIYRGITVDSKGNPQLAMNLASRNQRNTALAQSINNQNVSGPEYAAAYVAKLAGFQNLAPAILEEILINGAGTVQNMQDAREDGDAIGPTKATAQTIGGNGTDVVYTNVTETVKAPAHLIKSIGQAGVQAITDLDSNPLYVPVEGQNTVSDANANIAPVDRVGEPNVSPQPQVQGISTTEQTSAREPRVLHTISQAGPPPEEDSLKLHTRDTLKGPGVGQTFHHQPGPEHFLGFIRGKTTGCGCAIGNMITTHYNDIVANII